MGDWVAIDVIEAEGKALIHSILPSRTKLSRKEAGRRAAEQILVTNVDTVFLMMSLNADLNPRRIERYLGTLWESGALPVIVLSKADLCSDPSIAVIRNRRGGAGSRGSRSQRNYWNWSRGTACPTWVPGNTVVLLGSSGVGKSTLINRLLKREVQKTLEVRCGGRSGRHATTFTADVSIAVPAECLSIRPECGNFNSGTPQGSMTPSKRSGNWQSPAASATAAIESEPGVR